MTELERSRQRLESQNQRLDKVAATVSHDLRNPLTIATGYVDLVADEIDDPETRTYLEEVENAHDRMRDIVGDVLTIAREGGEVTERTRIGIEACAEAAWENVDTDDASLVLTGGGTVMADRSRVLTIFENLFRNSVEHAGGDATITVEVFADGFAVADDGPGIPDDTSDDVFEYGYSTTQDGTGLGLTIVRTMAESHGWQVDIDPDNDGARFVFSGVDVEPRNGE